MAKSKAGQKIVPAKQFGTVIRAKNGDVINYDPSGLVMRLSDKVITDIQRRLAPDPETHKTARPLPTSGQRLDPEILGDIDAWDLRVDGDWYVFSANMPGKQGPRQFRRLIDQGDGQADIIADTSGAFYGLLSIGGSRRAGATDRRGRFPHHVVATGDDIGAVGVAGIEAAVETPLLQTLPEQTRDALIGETILAARYSENRAMPLILARAETDSSASIADLANGPAFENLMQVAKNLKLAANTMGKRARLLAIGIDFGLEDITSGGAGYRDGMHALMEKIELSLGKLGFRKPLFVATFDSGTHLLSDTAVLRAQWELAWNSGDHNLVYSAPGYMFAQTDTGRPTENARLEMAEMDAAAITATNEADGWMCPVFLLAERTGDGSTICARARAMGDLVIDESDPLNAGPNCGFRLSGVTNGAIIESVTRSKDDAQDILIKCSASPKGDNLQLLYGFGAPDSPDSYPAARGAIRDGWSGKSATGRTLHRWALPCAIPIH